MRSDQIMNLLATKHAEDVFVSECNDGPACYGGHLRMDAWVMSKSWANPCVTVYEAKTSRGDFLKDEKWQRYLAYCNKFYFACPAGVILPEECPPEAGLMLVSANAGRVYTKKKAPYRQVTIPEQVYRYILMCRARITRDSQRSVQSKTDFWRQWLIERDERKDLGHAVSRKIQTVLRDRVFAAEAQHVRLQKLIDGYADIRSYLQQLKLDPDSNWQATRRRVEERLSELRKSRVPGLLRVAGDLQIKLTHFVAGLEEIKAQTKGMS